MSKASQLIEAQAFAWGTTFLAACGGGGSDTPSSTASATFPLDAAYTKMFINGVTVNGTAVDGADTYTLALTLTPAADEVFEGVARKKNITSLTLKKNGAVLTATNIQSYFSVNPFAQHGARYSDGTYGVMKNSGNFSSAARVGDGGALGILTTYTDSSRTRVVNTVESTWTLEADTATTAFGCTNSVLRDAAGTLTGTQSGCFKIDTSGNALGTRYTLSVAGKTLVFK